MVTGVEVAGLVLGSIPLLISALEHYEETVEPTVAFLKWKGNLSKAIDELTVIYASYDQSLQLLLKPIANAADLAKMMDDAKHALWSQGDVADDLRSHMKTAYDSCILTIEEIAETLVEVAKNLNIPGATLVSQRDLSSLIQANPPTSKSQIPKKKFQFKKRVAFTMKRRALKSMMARLERCIKRLSDFTEKAQKLEEDVPKTRRRIRYAGSLVTIRENALKIYQVLVQCWCNSHLQTRAGLLLDSRIVKQNKGRRAWRPAPVPAADCFALYLDERLPGGKWLTTEFRIPDPPSSTSTTVAITVSGPGSQSQQEPYSNPATLQEVALLCCYLQSRATPSVGFCIDDNQKLRVYAGNVPQNQYISQEMTLEQALPQLSKKLFNGDLYALAITLVASVFQLGETPWLDKIWNKKGILFIRARDSSSNSVDVKYPVLMQNFMTGIASTSVATVPSVQRDRTILLALGIMLLEITCAQPIDVIRESQDLGGLTAPTEETDHKTAIRWLFELDENGNLTRGFSSAITTCLQAYMNPRASFSDPDFERMIEEMVLRPLQDEMEFLLDGPPT